jgi:hypothetical protein
MNQPKPTYLNVLIVEEYESSGGKGRNWTKIGVAFPHADGAGFNIELKAFPRDGKLVVLPPFTEERDDKAAETRAAIADPSNARHAPAAKGRAR